MATLAGSHRPRRSLAPDRVEQGVGLLAAAMLLVLLLALWRGRDSWAGVDLLIWLHLATISLALALTPVLLLRRRGDIWHRRLGWTWCLAMAATAMISFGIRESSGGISAIHFFSIFTLVSLPFIVLTARKHQHEAHRRTVRGLLIGALLFAGLFTLLPFRLLGTWLLG